MGSVCESCGNQNKQGISYIECIYDIKDYIETQIMNDRGEKYINEEIGRKIKILNGNQKESLIFKKRFNKLGINTIKFIIEEKLNDMSYMFNKCSSLKEIHFFSVDTSQVTKMVAMFQLCSELENLDLTCFNTSNVTDLGWMFFQCNKLKEIKGLNNFNTKKVVNMTNMFVDCKKLENLSLSNFDTSNVTSMDGIFCGCSKLKEIQGINNFNTIYVTNN